MTTLPELIEIATEWGFFTYYLPFLIVFVMFYAILMKTKIFGDDRRIAFVIAIIAALYVMTMGGTVGAFISTLFTGGSIFLVVMLLILMIAGLVVGDRAWDRFTGGRPLGGLLLFAIIVGVGLFYLAGGLEILGLTMPGVPTEFPFEIDQDTIIIIGILIFTLIIIWWMVGAPAPGGVRIIPEW